MKMLSTSPKDDFINLCYTLVYMLDKKLHFLENTNLNFTKIQERKEKLSPSQLCITNASKILLQFVTAVFSIKYGKKPDYNYLKFLLIKELLNFDQTPCDDIYGRVQTKNYADKNYLNE